MGTVKRLRRFQRDTVGAAAVEFALVLPLLMLLVLGGLDWGYYFFVAQVTTNAAREGARAGSLELVDVTSTTKAQAAVVTYLAAAGLDSSKAAILPTLIDGGDTVRVEVTYPAGSLTGFVQVIVPANAHATSEMRRR
jgi:Flp pilus assembly protein TadG